MTKRVHSSRQVALKRQTHELIDESGIPHKDVAGKCGWQPAYLSALLSPKSEKRIKRTHIAKIAAIIGYEEDLFFKFETPAEIQAGPSAGQAGKPELQVDTSRHFVPSQPHPGDFETVDFLSPDEIDQLPLVYQSLRDLLSNRELMRSIRMTRGELSEIMAIRLRQYKPTEQFWIDVINRLRLDEGGKT